VLGAAVDVPVWGSIRAVAGATVKRTFPFHGMCWSVILRRARLHYRIVIRERAVTAMLRQIRLENVLSFGPDSPALPLCALNVLIGPIGSGKSNLIEAIALLQSAPRALASTPRDGGGIREWLWKGLEKPVATVDVVVDNPGGNQPLRHTLSFRENAQRFELVDEVIQNEKPYTGKSAPYFYYRFEKNRPILNVKGKKRSLAKTSIPSSPSSRSARTPISIPRLPTSGRCTTRSAFFEIGPSGATLRRGSPNELTPAMTSCSKIARISAWF
jgi:hypothetical protein